ncbi:DUF6695 family protein [Saccharicrinis aurantiacus]|uniref:DUF6695 family protein n=1 Tax=Saccharicrinis aurantiacus TaxID=1849719 RepID=UPI000838702A|nr:DUF6695 family protein [Saccharicrinis aurantiacus]
MRLKKTHTGFAIAIAWPDTYCKQPGSWYDPLMSFLGINKNNYYKVGHAALCLINSEDGEVLYFDFGRYHSPFKHGRVRGSITDPELRIKTKAQIDEKHKKLINFSEILNELQENASCHGEGPIHASYCTINFNQAHQKVLQLQSDFIPYGPFLLNGSNCSRFVNKAILAGNPNFKTKVILKFGIPLTPTPIGNVKALTQYTTLAKQLTSEPFYPNRKLTKEDRNSVLRQPRLPHSIPSNSQWLSGEGAGSWFSLYPSGNLIKVIRYSPLGSIEDEGLFCYSKKTDNSIKNGLITYPSNSKVITLFCKEKKTTLHRIQ